jgi:colanic acid biosynthesis glycosyl transferase WcaI
LQRSLYNSAVRILLLNLYFPPDTSATAKLAATVAEALSANHDVTIVCGRPSYDPAGRHPWRLWQREHNGRVTVLRVGSTDYPRFQMKKRVLNYLSYVALAVPRALFVPCDAVLAMTDPPFEGIVGAFVALLKRKPYVYNIRDMYPDMALGSSLLRPGLLSWLWERLHRWALRRAKRVIVLGGDMRERIIAKGVEASRVVVVRDGTEIAPVGAPAPQLDSEVIRAIRGDFRFVLLHAGNLGFYGAWETLLAAARQLESHGIGLVFVGEGAQLEKIQAAAAGAKNVRFLPFFPGSKIPSVLAAADAHIITVKRGLEGVVVPSKLYDILAAGKPLLVVAPPECEAARIAAGRGCGLAADPGKPDDVAAASLLLASDPESLRRMSEAARAAAPDYDRLKELQRFVEIVEEAGNA